MLSKLLHLLNPQEQKRGALLLGMMLVMALLDMGGVASIMPFIAVLANPELVQSNALLQTAFSAASHFGVTDTDQFLFLLGILVFVLLVISLTFKALTTYAQLRFVEMRNYSISMRLIEGYLRQPYSWFFDRHSAELGKSILSEVSYVVSGGLAQMLNLIAQTVVTIGLLALLFFVNFKLALFVSLTFAVSYGLIFKVSRRYLARIGEARIKANQGRFTAVSEAFGAMKAIKVGGLEQTYVQRFSEPARIFARHQANVQVISLVPRFALEAIAFGGMLLIILVLMAQSASFSEALPVIALYAFAGYRLMPALQQIYVAVTHLRFAGPAVEALHSELTNLAPVYGNEKQDLIPLKHSISLNNVNYSYPNSPQPAVTNLSITIPAKTKVGLVGATGSGKTTTADLILSLLDAESGALAVDGQVITARNKRGWQCSIGYVPQQISLCDDSVAANIAFGIDDRDIDQEAVEHASKIANLHEFVTKELPDQYQTAVGERGVRLSGGQRQRIGIARAIYHKPQVLVLDEATSALDNLTERAVMDALQNLENQTTTIIIAHRLSTVESCDWIFLLEHGELIGQGTFTDLCESNEFFRAMAVQK